MNQNRFLAFSPQFGLQPTDPLAAYEASPMSGAVGLAIDGLTLWGAYHLWTHGHRGWGGVLGILGLGGVGFNLYKMTRPQP